MNDMLYALKTLVFLLLTMPLFSTVADVPTITSVTAQQRYPWNGFVDIAVTFNGAQSDVSKANCTFAATDSVTKNALAIAHVTPQGDATGSGTTWTRRFVWDTNADVGEVKIDDVELVADIGVVDEPGSMRCAQLWEGGPYWAECNVGASNPEEYGLYFCWGDTVGHTGDWDFNDSNCPTYGKNNSQLRAEGYVDSSGNLVPTHDAARAHLGTPWRMPTRAEFGELISKCDISWTTSNGVNGRLVTGRGVYASRSIFFPAAGYGFWSSRYDLGTWGGYWSATSDADYSTDAWYHRFDSSYWGQKGGFRCYGRSVRPVRDFSK